MEGVIGYNHKKYCSTAVPVPVTLAPGESAMGRGFDLCGAELSFILFDGILKVYIICIAKAETFANYKLESKYNHQHFTM